MSEKVKISANDRRVLNAIEYACGEYDHRASPRDNRPLRTAITKGTR